MDLRAVEEKLAYKFNDEQLLIQALTHPSKKERKNAALHYERLEYLGDAVLELVVSRELFTQFPKADEGALTKLRSAIVSRKHLAGLSEQLGWGEQLDMDAHVAAQGGREILSILANTFESVIGAVMMDSNYKAARKVSLLLLADSLKNVASICEDTNPKGTLLELLQAINPIHPIYVVEDISAPTKPLYRATVSWQDKVLASAEGTSKRRAEKAAAQQALDAKVWE
ncbi:MAG: ribonuclease III [Akkermansia sp.]